MECEYCDSLMVIDDLRCQAGEVSFTLDGPFGERSVRFWGDVPASSDPPVEAALAAALLPAMTVGGELSLPGPLSPRVGRALPDVQAVLASLAAASSHVSHPLHTVDVVAPARSVAQPTALRDSPGGVGAFFSGGADSWSTLLANPDVTDLIYVHGFDIPIGQMETSAVVERRLAETAGKLGKRLNVVRTDLRDPSISWEIAHGSALAAVALLFEPRCERVLIGAGMSYGNLIDRGSHPLLDHLWSTERCRIEHHGAHLTRAAKIRQIASSQEALEVLRVCWREVDRYNCGRCEKCLRTMVALEAIGALERCPTFPGSLDLDAVSNLAIDDSDLTNMWRENLALAREQHASRELVSAIEACLAACPEPGGTTLCMSGLPKPRPGRLPSPRSSKRCVLLVPGGSPGRCEAQEPGPGDLAAADQGADSAPQGRRPGAQGGGQSGRRRFAASVIALDHPCRAGAQVVE